MASGPIFSPAAAMGMAGGQETVGEPQIRPKAAAAGIVSWTLKKASRIDTVWADRGRDGKTGSATSR